MKSKLNKEYKQLFNELRDIINSWELILDSPIDEFDSINHLFLKLLYKDANEVEISRKIQFELNNNYGFSIGDIIIKEMTIEVIEWWNNKKSYRVL